MDLFTLLFRLPLMPLRGLLRVAEVIRDQAESELYSPGAARRELEQAAGAREAGEMSEEQVAAVEREVTERMVAGSGERTQAG
ncbi:MAG: gas vesicle protein GvpG [Streptosporangiaceae bacterium]